MSSSSLDMTETGDNLLSFEHHQWKKKTPFLYDFIISHALPLPSSTVDWSSLSPRPHTEEPTHLSLHTLLFNTVTDDDENSSSFLTIADVSVPTNDDPISIIPKVEVARNIVLDQILSIARFMPKNPNIVCAKTGLADMFVFDCTKHQEGSGGDQPDHPDLRLTGLRQNVFVRSALAWHPIKEGYILGSDGTKICLWNIDSAMAQDNKVLGPMHAYEYEGRSAVVRDVQWHCKNEDLFGSVGYKGELVLWDLRTNQNQQSVEAHGSEEVNYLSFHPKNEWLLATASSDSTVGLFDMRKLTRKFYTLKGHTEKTIQVEWDPYHGSVLASSGVDRKLIIWDIKRIGDEKSKGDSEDKPPELLFSHEGHMDTVKDFSWNKHEPLVISSVAGDKTLHVWKLAKSIYGNIATIDD